MMRTWEERVKLKYGVSRHGGGKFRISMGGVEAAGVDRGFHVILPFVPSPVLALTRGPSPQSPTLAQSSACVGDGPH